MFSCSYYVSEVFSIVLWDGYAIVEIEGMFEVTVIGGIFISKMGHCSQHH